MMVLIIRELGNSWAGRPAVASLHENREAAESELLAYVRRNWEFEIGIPPPEDPEDVVREYFNEAAEAYDIAEVLEGKP
jgi:hypothetical protein